MCLEGEALWTYPQKFGAVMQVGGYVAMNLVMPAMLSWVLGGNLRVFKESDRRPLCHINDKPKHFAEQVGCLTYQLSSNAVLQHATKYMAKKEYVTWKGSRKVARKRLKKERKVGNRAHEGLVCRTSASS